MGGLTATVVLLALVVAPGCDEGGHREAKRPKPAAPPPEKNWTPEEISKDPVGYLQDQDARAERQINERNQRLEQVKSRREQTTAKRDQLAANMAELQNVRDRLSRAMRRAEEEDRWPVMMGGRSFSREKATAVIASCEQYVQDRKQLAEAYEQTVGRLNNLESQMQKQIQDLRRLRERIGIDIERVRLNQGLAELGDLQRTETEVASFSKMLGTMDENILSSISAQATTEPARVDVESILK
jgi:chromosome segregation ATPase